MEILGYFSGECDWLVKFKYVYGHCVAGIG